MDDPTPWPRVAAYLARHGLALDQDPPPRRFPGGLANINTLIHLSGRPHVLRRPPPGPLPPGAHDMAREHRILSVLPDALPIAPRSLHLCTDTDVLGVPFQVIEFRDGRVVRATLPDDLADAGPALSATLIDTLAAVHAVDTAALGLDTLGRPEGFLARAVDGWRRRGLLVAEGATAGLIGEVGAWLDAHKVPDGSPVPDRRPVLLHNDFKLDNLLLDPETLQPTGLVDWDQGTRGDPLFDLATLLSYWTEPGDPPAMHALGQMPTAAPGFWSREQAAQAYAARTGRGLADFRFHRTLGILKLGVIFLQLHALHRKGATDDPRYVSFGPLAHGLLEVAHDVAAGRMF